MSVRGASVRAATGFSNSASTTASTTASTGASCGSSWGCSSTGATNSSREGGGGGGGGSTSTGDASTGWGTTTVPSCVSSVPTTSTRPAETIPWTIFIVWNSSSPIVLAIVSTVRCPSTRTRTL